VILQNLFKKQSTKFHKNYPSFVEDITENISGLFFPDTLVVKLWGSDITFDLVSRPLIG